MLSEIDDKDKDDLKGAGAKDSLYYEDLVRQNAGVIFGGGAILFTSPMYIAYLIEM